MRPEIEVTDRMRDQVKVYAAERNIDMARAWSELVTAGIELKCEDPERALEESYREFEQRNHEIHEQWDGMSREANELLGPAPAIETDDSDGWEPDAGE